MANNENKLEKLYVGPNGFVYAGEAKIAKLDSQRGVIQFLDRDRRRNTRRGGDQIEVSLQEFSKLLPPQAE